MSHEEFRFWLNAIHWTLPQLAEMLECDLSYVEALDRGDVEAPPPLALWLSTVGKAHAELSVPTVCRGWKYAAAPIDGAA